MTAWQPEQEAISIQIPHMCQRCPTGACLAKGYTTYRSPEGADGGVDILAAVGELGWVEEQGAEGAAQKALGSL